MNRVNVRSWRKLRENSSTVQCKPRESNLINEYVQSFGEREYHLKGVASVSHVPSARSSSHSKTTSVYSSKFECKLVYTLPSLPSQTIADVIQDG